MYKNFRVSEEEKKQILEMHQSNGYNAASNLINEQGGQDPAWIKQADSNLNFNAKVKSGYGPTSATYVAGTPDNDFVIILPKGSKFVPSGSGAFLLTQGYLVNKESLIKNGGLTYETLYNSPGMVAKALQSGKLNPRTVNIAATDAGTIVYEGGSTLMLGGSGSALSSAIKQLYA